MGLNLTRQINKGEKTDWFSILATELQTAADRTSGEYIHPTAKGMMLKLVVGNEAGTFSATLNIQTKDADGNWVTVYTSAAVAANGTVLYYFHPEGGTNSLFTIVPFSIPRVHRFLLDYTGTPASDKADTSLQGCYI